MILSLIHPNTPADPDLSQRVGLMGIESGRNDTNSGANASAAGTILSLNAR